ncbi:ABC transporter ATP-binding protein [Aureimonas leprariae]|uniref:ABC transporter ATP-binding protein n=1 Tax=Plantimonas leprariae TaxID=2615207 RepID=A0A7V7PLR5_9HYPH|nr:ABC transporter ATP-binding protein [Aureimonas leprariae]KAB0677418.1 ABC transporter ATP-binding protein [Aureimonas leprariae]
MVSLALEGVGVRYGHTEVVGGVTVPTLRGGGLTAVIGPNAAGKSSLFKRIAGLASGPGTVHVEGDGAGSIRYMPQDTGANAVLTLYESVVLAAKLGSSLRVSDAELAHIDEILDALRIADIAFRNLGELSGGQRQLAGIAQALVRRPRILLMDEPTAALDLHRQMEVLSLMRGLARRDDMVVLIAIHDLNHALRFCADTIVVANGRMAACGPSAEIVTAELLRDVYRVSGRIERCSHGLPHVIVDGPLEAGAVQATL